MFWIFRNLVSFRCGVENRLKIERAVIKNHCFSFTFVWLFLVWILPQNKLKACFLYLTTNRIQLREFLKTAIFHSFLWSCQPWQLGAITQKFATLEVVTFCKRTSLIYLIFLRTILWKYGFWQRKSRNRTFMKTSTAVSLSFLYDLIQSLVIFPKLCYAIIKKNTG